jgi:hypothetical protein
MCFVVAFVVNGCGRPIGSLEIPEKLTLYSIDGRDFAPAQRPEADEEFHGYPVLGKVEITDAAKRKEIIRALNRGLARSDGTVAKCFWPRHAIHAVTKGRTIEYVICFQCYQLEAHADNSKSVKPITREPQPVLDKHLERAGIPLVPKEEAE